MKVNIKYITIGILALVVGLIAGYFLFGNQNAAQQMSETHDKSDKSDLPENKDQVWTCSMHPQVRQSEPGLCPICEMDLILLEANTSNDPLVLQMTKQSVKLANIQTFIIGEKEGSTSKTIKLSGKVKTDERLASSLVAHIPGRIEKLFVSFTGEQVNKGQKLATIYSPNLISAQRELLEAIKLKEISPGLLEAARNKLKFWKLDSSFIKSVEEKGTVQETFTLYAAESGIVTNRKVAVGDYINQGEVLFDLMNIRRVWVLFDAYEEDLSSISIGDRIEFTTPSIANKTFKTKVTFIDPLLNPTTRVASVRTEINNVNRSLKPEMFVNGLLKKKKNSVAQLTVPKSAVLWTGIRSVVYVKVPDVDIPSFQYREVEIGESIGNQYLIVSGLESGEEVVTNGNFTIDAAAQLNNQASMMNRNVTVKSEGDHNATPNFRAGTAKAFKIQLGDLTKAYISLKDAFVSTDAKLAIEKAKAFSANLKNVDMSLLKGEAHDYWMEQLEALGVHGDKISELEDVEKQRKQFGFLSESMINSIDAFGTVGDSIFVQFCPMAFDNDGANWLSFDKPIQNPYFGDKMMKCGVVKKNLSEERKDPIDSSPKQNQVHNH